MAAITTAELDGLDGDVRSAVLPIEALAKLKADIARFGETEKLNGFQQWITREGYILDVPELPFEAKSIVIVTARFHMADLVFTFGEKRLHDLHCLDRIELVKNIETLFDARGYHAKGFFWLPQKRLAVCAGLAEYGRNNIAYAPEWGSLFHILTYLTDMPCEKAYTWREAKRMALCDTCRVCLDACPTGAIKEETYLIDNVTCLTLFVEDNKPFPDWIPREAHHSVIGCYRCQENCPKNAGRLRDIEETIEFDETESAMLALGITRADMPAALAEKAALLGFDEYRLKSFPKNFKVLLEK